MKNNFLEVVIDDINVLCVSTLGVKGSVEAFRTLESKLPTLKSRKFYGVLIGNSDNGIYRACVASLPGENYLGVEKWVIPGGKYVKAKISDWEKHTYLIAQTFSSMATKFRVDDSRPSVEYYKSQKELLLLLPIS